MVRIAGIDLPRNKKISYALTKIYGIGLVNAKNIIKMANINENIKVTELTDEQISQIRLIITNNYKIEGDLKRTISLNIKRLSEIDCYRGRRHRQKLPLRGQRTRTNARNRRGNKQTVAGKKK